MAFNEAGASTASPLADVLKNLYQIVAGLGAAVVFGFLMYIPAVRRLNIKAKFVLMFVIAMFITLGSEFIAFHESKYIGVIFYGFFCFRFWGEEKPEHEFERLWVFLMPFLFGSVGAAVRLDRVDGDSVGLGIAVILIGVTCRWCGAVGVMMQKKYTWKERFFVGFTWIPKATVQAAIGGAVLDQARADGVTEYESYGKMMLTTSVMAIIFTAPTGAILTNTLGPKWLIKKSVTFREVNVDKEEIRKEMK